MKTIVIILLLIAIMIYLRVNLKIEKTVYGYYIEVEMWVPHWLTKDYWKTKFDKK